MLCHLFPLPPRSVMSELTCCLHCKSSVAALALGPLYIMDFVLYACLVFSPLNMLDIAIGLGSLLGALQPLLLCPPPPPPGYQNTGVWGGGPLSAMKDIFSAPILFFLGFPFS